MAYAYTLAGHEYVANEDYDKAKKCFKQALNVDHRHYNAWWGLGNIALK
jgi:anaphase-promoting complex subunit 3